MSGISTVKRNNNNKKAEEATVSLAVSYFVGKITLFQ